MSELAGPCSPALAKPAPLPCPSSPHAAWRFHDWAWDSRALCWRAEWHHVSHPLTVRDYDEYVAGTLNYRHWRMAAMPAALLDSFFPIGGADVR